MPAPAALSSGARRAFVRTLVCAELNARDARECQFTNDVRDRFERAGEPPRLSQQERRALHRLAKQE